MMPRKAELNIPSLHISAQENENCGSQLAPPVKTENHGPLETEGKCGENGRGFYPEFTKRL